MAGSTKPCGSAPLLTGFSLYTPGRPAARARFHRSARLVFARRRSTSAFARSSRTAPSRATLADRDRISGDDNVEIHLDTFDERNRALRVHRQSARRPGRRHEERRRRVHSRLERRAGPERSERRLPLAVARPRHRVRATRSRFAFRSAACAIRVGDVQHWGLQIDRHVQHTGYEETWTPARARVGVVHRAGGIAHRTARHASRRRSSSSIPS